MAFSHALGGNGTPPESLQVTAAVTFVPGTGITGSHLLVSAKVPGLSEDDFQRIAEEAKAGCPVSGLMKLGRVTPRSCAAFSR